MLTTLVIASLHFSRRRYHYRYLCNDIVITLILLLVRLPLLAQALEQRRSFQQRKAQTRTDKPQSFYAECVFLHEAPVLG
ncbi:MAG: hypothetical protein V7K95_10295 [Nostoc sp.]